MGAVVCAAARALTGACSIAGVALVSVADDLYRNAAPPDGGWHMSASVQGDILALISAVLYGVYSVYLQRRIGDERAIDMFILFGTAAPWSLCLERNSYGRRCCRAHEQGS